MQSILWEQLHLNCITKYSALVMRQLLYMSRQALWQPISRLMVGKNYGYVAGDANGDREVNISDVNTIVDAILDGKQEINYDMNDDFEVNIADINAVIDYILNH